MLLEYNIKVLEDCPVVKYGNATRPMYLPVDVCIVLPGQHTGRKLENDEIETMRNFAARDPVLNAQSITADGPRMIGMVPEVNSQLVSLCSALSGARKDFTDKIKGSLRDHGESANDHSDR